VQQVEVQQIVVQQQQQQPEAQQPEVQQPAAQQQQQHPEHVLWVCIKTLIFLLYSCTEKGRRL